MKKNTQNFPPPVSRDKRKEKTTAAIKKGLVKKTKTKSKAMFFYAKIGLALGLKAPITIRLH